MGTPRPGRGLRDADPIAIVFRATDPRRKWRDPILRPADTERLGTTCGPVSAIAIAIGQRLAVGRTVAIGIAAADAHPDTLAHADPDTHTHTDPVTVTVTDAHPDAVIAGRRASST
jgi:hypothetical protein